MGDDVTHEVHFYFKVFLTYLTRIYMEIQVDDLLKPLSLGNFRPHLSQMKGASK